MGNLPHKSIALPNRTYQAIARVEIKRIAQSIGFKAHRLAEIEIIVAEVTSNLIKHATLGGEILAGKFVREELEGIEIICIDNGPGISFPQKMMEDGVTTAGTLGQGLGAIKRLSDEFDFYSLKEWGTIVLSRVYLKKQPKHKPSSVSEVKAIMVAKTGETLCGDDWAVQAKGNQLKLVLADGLGHGPDAAEASNKAREAFFAEPKLLPVEQLKFMHQQIRKTRGSVIAIAHIDFSNKQLLFCGIGNIAAKIYGLGKSRTCMSYNGIVGHTIPATLNNHTFTWDKNDILILHSDGISARWDLQRYPGITKHDGTIIAAALYKDHNRKNDDVTIAVTRYNPK